MAGDMPAPRVYNFTSPLPHRSKLTASTATAPLCPPPTVVRHPPVLGSQCSSMAGPPNLYGWPTGRVVHHTLVGEGASASDAPGTATDGCTSHRYAFARTALAEGHDQRPAAPGATVPAPQNTTSGASRESVAVGSPDTTRWRRSPLASQSRYKRHGVPRATHRTSTSPQEARTRRDGGTSQEKAEAQRRSRRSHTRRAQLT